MSLPMIDFTGATFKVGGSLYNTLPDGTKTNVRNFRNIVLADGTKFDYSHPEWRWRKWIVHTGPRHWSQPDGYYRKVNQRYVYLLDRAWAENFKESDDGHMDRDTL